MSVWDRERSLLVRLLGEFPNPWELGIPRKRAHSNFAEPYLLTCVCRPGVRETFQSSGYVLFIFESLAHSVGPNIYIKYSIQIY